MKTGPCFKDMKRFNCSVYIFFKKLICSEMKPLYNYNTFKILGYREYVMRVLFCGQCYESMQYCWIIYLLVETCFDFVWKKWFFIRRSKRFLGFFCQAVPSYEDFTFELGDIPKVPWKIWIFMKYWYLTSLPREKIEKNGGKIQIIHCL